MLARIIPTGLALLGLATATVAAAPKQRTPYYASISASQARMRTGPGRQYPASWLYRRADLPVRVLVIYGDWRKVEDPDGTQGWLLGSLLSATRTAIVTGGVVELRAKPQPDASVLWRAAPGVVGRLSKCAEGWCRFDVHGSAGFVEATRLWGIDPAETIG